MSTYYRPSTPLPLQILKERCEDGTIDNLKVILDENKNGMLFDGINYIHFDVNNDKNYIIDLYRYGGNDESEIFEKISNEFDINFVSEYEEEYSDLAVEETNVIQIKLERDNA